MHYSMYRPQEKKIPIPVALLVLLLMVAGAMTFIKRPDLRIKQKTSVEVTTLEVGNIRDNTASIFWQTSEKSESYLVYGTRPNSVELKAFDEKDTSKRLIPKKNHYVVLSNLRPNSTYYYRLVNNGQETLHLDKNSFILKTTRPVTTSLDIAPIYGEIKRKNGTPAQDTIVSLNIGSSYPIIARTKNDGSFLLSPCCIFKSDSMEPFYPSSDQQISLHLYGEDNEHETIETSLADISPLREPIVMGSQKGLLADKGEVLAEMDEIKVLLESEDLETFNPIDIIYPKKDSAIPGSKPLIKGVGEPGKKVKGRFDPDGKLFETKVKDDRVWLFSPSFNLSSGAHTLTVITEDAVGNEVVLTRSFSILKSGESVLGSATPSATLTPEVYPTEEITPEPTSEPTIEVISPTGGPLEDPGTNIIPAITLSLSLIILGLGVILIY